MSCPHCQADARCKGFRWRAALTLLGAIHLRRHCDHCPDCGQGSCPRDALLGLGTHDLTPAADEVVCLAGVQTSFDDAATKLLPKLANLRLSESTAERATEAAGQRLLQALQAGQTFGPATPWDWHKDAEGKTVADVSVDATGVGMQGENGARAEGRMAYVGVLYNPVPPERTQWADPTGARPEWQARYLAQLQPLAALAAPLRKQAGQVGLDDADHWVALSDGGSGLEDFLRDNFGRVEAVILDFWHAAEYLGNLSKALRSVRVAGCVAWVGSPARFE